MRPEDEAVVVQEAAVAQKAAVVQEAAADPAVAVAQDQVQSRQAKVARATSLRSPKTRRSKPLLFALL